MRLIGTLHDRKLAQEFSYYLIKEGVQNQFEPSSQDEEALLIWIVDEDQVEFATREFEAFIQDPSNPKFYGHYRHAKKVEEAAQEQRREHQVANEEIVRRSQNLFRPGILTIVLIVVSAIVLYFSNLEVVPLNAHQDLIVVKPPASTLLFDFPPPFQLYQELATRYQPAELERPKKLPPEGQALLQEALGITWWQGLYAELVSYLSHPSDYHAYTGPLFVKIGQGQVWRLFSPALLHLDIIHLLFNMIWLYVLGTQIEGRIGWMRYLLIVLLGAAATNFCQYLVSGPLFMGMSGVVTTLFGLIWMRQRRAPWEGYQLHRVTVAFIIAFVVAMLIFQLISFGFEVAGRGGIGPPIANTAHIIGLLFGALLGRFDFFAYHEVKIR